MTGWLVAFLCASAMASFGPQTIPLAGDWRFRLDPGDAESDSGWCTKTLPDRIKLPGSTAENGYGDPVSVETRWTGGVVERSWYADPAYERYRQPGKAKVPFWLTPVRTYVGPAWYQRDIVIPRDWAGRRAVLFLERPHWETRAWVDGRPFGTQNSLSAAHEYDLGPLAPGKHLLTIRVDNRVKVAVGENAHSVSDHTQTNWNGIVGRIQLIPRNPVWIEDIQVHPDIRSKKARVVVTVGNATGGPIEGTLAIKVAPLAGMSVRWSVTGTAGTVEANYPLGDKALLWDEFSPNLYKMRVSLSTAGSGSSDAKSAVFGLREFKADGTRFAVNGRPVFLRGTLECAIFPLTGYPPVDVEPWLRILKIARAHGLNHVRFHSWCPPEAAFAAADRMGFYLSIECASWTSVGDGGEYDRWLYAEGDRILRAYGNHPSFCMLLYGNEPSGGNQDRFLGDLVSYWKKKDPRRIYSSASGWPQIPENDFHVTPEPRAHWWSGGLATRFNAKPAETTTDYRDVIGRFKVPVISHEIGQYCAYPDFDEIREYTGVTRAGNFGIFRDSLREHHLLDQAHDFLIASGRLQTILYKEEIESALRTPGMGGFALLDLHDFPGQGTALVGVLNAFWKSKGYVTPKEYRRFAGETVPLARMAKRVFTDDETFRAEVEIAHFGPVPIRDARPAWTVADAGGRIVAEGKLPSATMPVGNCFPLGKVALPLAGLATRKLVLSVTIEGTAFSNSWDFWVYPRQDETTPLRDVLITGELGDDAVAVLKSGGKVLLVPGPGRVRGDRHGRIPAGFGSIFWNTAWTGRQPPHTLGILCDPSHPLLAGFPTESHSNWQWWYVISRSQFMILDGLPPKVRPIVQVIDDWVTNRRLGLVFEARVLGGKLLVCSVDLASSTAGNPVVTRLKRVVYSYMSGPEFRPSNAVEVDAIRGLLAQPSLLQLAGARVTYADSAEPGNEAENCLDGDPSTMWHTEWRKRRPGYPHEIRIELEHEVVVKGFRLLPRQDGAPSGWIRRCAFHSSADGRDWGAPLGEGEFARTADEKTFMLKAPVRTRYLKLVALSGFDGQQWASLAEVDLITE